MKIIPKRPFVVNKSGADSRPAPIIFKNEYSQLNVSRSIETETHVERRVDLAHHFVVQMAHLFSEPPFVYRPDLLEQNDRVALEPDLFSVYVDMRRQFRFAEPARYRRGDDGRRVFVAYVVLNDKNGSHPALFAPDDGRQIRKINISSFYGHLCRAVPFLRAGDRLPFPFFGGLAAVFCYYYCPRAVRLNADVFRP